MMHRTAPEKKTLAEAKAPLELVRSIADEIGLKIEFRAENKAAWNSTLDICPYVPADYANFSVDYQLAYQSGQGGAWNDVSVIIYHGDKLAGVWPLTVSYKDNDALISSQGMPLHPPLFDKNLALSAQRELSDLCLGLTSRLAEALGLTSFKSAESHADTPSLGQWHTRSVTGGAVCQVQHEMYLKIAGTIDDIQNQFRKKLRYTIRQASQLWKSKILLSTSENIESVWREFQNLHLQASGKKTRNDASWRLQMEAIQNNDAFLIYLRDDAGAMVGGGFFSFSRDEGLYAVGAYDRSLFDKPIGHLVQYEAIKQFIERGIRWYKIGYFPCPADLPAPTEKDVSIRHFKKQFSSHLFPKFILLHQVTDAETEAVED